MLSCTIMNVVVLSVVMLSFSFAILSVVMLRIIMLRVVILSVVLTITTVRLGLGFHTHKHYTVLKIPASDKHASLSSCSINYAKKVL